MTLPKTIGFPRMHKEPGERRVFLPDFVHQFTQWGLEVCLETGYGSELGLTERDYGRGNAAVRRVERTDAFQQDIVLVLRSPERPEFDLLRPGNCLISMLHFPTRPWRVARLQELNINAIALDMIANDDGIRMVENMSAVAWNGLEAAFDALEASWPDLIEQLDEPVRVLILGTGLVGKIAVEAASKLGDPARYERYLAAGHPGALVTTVGRSATGNATLMQRLLAQTDVLVDATARHDPSLPVIPNAWIGWLPDHAVISDLAVDPYLLNDDPPVVRGVEGIPQGNLDQYVFLPDDQHWTRGIPESIPVDNRRTVASCYSWPGIYPEKCMMHYGRQLTPLMEVLVTKGYDGLSIDGGYFERALTRATMKHWLATTT